MPDSRLPPPGDGDGSGGTKDGEKDTDYKTEKTLEKDTAAVAAQSQQKLKTDSEVDAAGDLRYEKFGDGSIMVFSGADDQDMDDFIIHFDTIAASTGGDFLI